MHVTFKIRAAFRHYPAPKKDGSFSYSLKIEERKATIASNEHSVATVFTDRILIGAGSRTECL